MSVTTSPVVGAPPAQATSAGPGDIRIELVEQTQGSGSLALTNTAAGSLARWSLGIRLGGRGAFTSLTGDATTSVANENASADGHGPLGPGSSTRLQWHITGDAGEIACTLNGASCHVAAYILPPG